MFGMVTTRIMLSLESNTAEYSIRAHTATSAVLRVKIFQNKGCVW